MYDGSKTDWDDSHTDLAHLGGAPPGAAKSGGDKLWEDNWDDDDIEDDFSVQLRCVHALIWVSFVADPLIAGKSSRRRGREEKPCSTRVHLYCIPILPHGMALH